VHCTTQVWQQLAVLCFVHVLQAAEREANRVLQHAAAAAAAVNKQQQNHDGLNSNLPSSSTRLAAQIAARHEQQLRDQAAAAAGEPHLATALNTLATALRLRFSAAAGCDDMLCNQIVQLSLLLVSLEPGTGAPGHIDLAGALTYAFAVVENSSTAQQVQQQLQQPLARWLFISPDVFNSVPVLRRLLWLLQDQKQQRVLYARKGQQAATDAHGAAAATDGSAAAVEATPQSRIGTAAATKAATKGRAGAAAAMKATAAGRAARAARRMGTTALQPAGDAPEAAQRQAPLAVAAALSVEELEARMRGYFAEEANAGGFPAAGLSEGEHTALHALRASWALLAAEMQEVAAFMGQHAVLVDQSAGEGVDVKVGGVGRRDEAVWSYGVCEREVSSSTWH
jgi:hypothetical protein